MSRSKSSRRRLLLTVAALALAAFAAIAIAWVVYLDRVVTREFQGRLWSVPARVYAEPLDLYAGAPVGADDQIGRARVGKECRSRWSPYH